MPGSHMRKRAPAGKKFNPEAERPPTGPATMMSGKPHLQIRWPFGESPVSRMAWRFSTGGGIRSPPTAWIIDFPRCWRQLKFATDPRHMRRSISRDVGSHASLNHRQ